MYSTPNENKNRISVWLSSVRQSIEHIFSFHKNTYNLFNIADRFRLMTGGEDCYRLVMFFLLNSYVGLNESPNSFGMRPPTSEQYIPLDETLRVAPMVNDELLGEIYNYTVYDNNMNCIKYIAVPFLY